METGQLAVALGLGIGLVAVAGKVIVKILKTLRETPSPEDRKAINDEIRLLEDLSLELERMDDRIGALETILLDKKRKG
ncbi:MAG: hypothetical protein JRJ59_11070 [Deltaproteobacteria bacterium]|nr:hypothetical protein [Deltaproteobacteria bacterium]